MDTDYAVIPPLQAIFDGARDFGLTDAEVWQTVNESLCGAGGDTTVGEYIDDLVGALAARILTKQRRLLADDSR
jgi:hypothetical protein